MRRLALHWQILIGMLLGILWALLSSYMGWSKFTLDWINPFGTIFINLLKLIAVPLVVFSIIDGVSGISDGSKLGRMGFKTLLAYLITTIFAITIGLSLVNLFQPGTHISEEQRTKNRINYEFWVDDNKGASFIDDLRLSETLSADDLSAFRADYELISQEQEKASGSKMSEASKQKKSGPLSFVVDMVPSNFLYAMSNEQGKPSMLQVIFFAIFFGIVLLFIPKEKAAPVRAFVDGVNHVFLKMVDVIMQAAPFFVFALLAGKMSEMAGDDPRAVLEIFKGLGQYSLVVVLGLGTMIFVVYPTVVKVVTRKIGYGDFFRSIGPAQLMAFSTSSSAATLPVTLDCVRENLKVSEDVTNFVLPIGATVNMDGTSLYQAVAVIFLAQLHMVELGFAQQVTIVLTATLASIGSAAVPSAGLVMLILVLESVGLPGSWIAIIFPVDRILDMCRTTVNVTGDAAVCSIIAKTENELNFVPLGERVDNFEV